MDEQRFLGFDHIDTRVPSLARVEAFYDALMPKLGLLRKTYSNVDGDVWTSVDSGAPYNTVEYVEPKREGKAAFFMGIIEDQAMTPTRTRIAFRIGDRAALAEWPAFLKRIGAHKIELSEDMEGYPAVFFEDPAGTMLEVCCRLKA